MKVERVVLRGRPTALMERCGLWSGGWCCRPFFVSSVGLPLVPVGGEWTRAAIVIRSRELREALWKKILDVMGVQDRRETTDGRRVVGPIRSGSLGPLS